MKNKYDRLYFEEYALSSLILCYDEKLKAFLEEGGHAHRPDFQNEELNLGIEVRRAITKQQGSNESIINDYFGKNYDPSFVLKEIEKLKKKPGTFDIVNGTLSWFSGYYDTKTLIDELQSSIVEKLQKLNSGYRVFLHNWLYLFAGSSIIHETDITNLCNKKIEFYRIQFDKIFINCTNKIFILENYKLIQTIFLSDEELTQIKRRAFERVENNAS